MKVINRYKAKKKQKILLIDKWEKRNGEQDCCVVVKNVQSSIFKDT